MVERRGADALLDGARAAPVDGHRVDLVAQLRRRQAGVGRVRVAKDVAHVFGVGVGQRQIGQRMLQRIGRHQLKVALQPLAQLHLEETSAISYFQVRS